jgi:hypothetical protein
MGEVGSIGRIRDEHSHLPFRDDLLGSLFRGSKSWCPEWESNPHDPKVKGF